MGWGKFQDIRKLKNRDQRSAVSFKTYLLSTWLPRPLQIAPRLLGWIFLLLNCSCLNNKKAVILNPSNNPKGSAQLQVATSTTNQKAQKLTLTSPDAQEMAFFVDQSCRPTEAKWEAYTSEKTLTLPEVDGPHTISVLFRNENHFVSECQTITVVLDTTGPSIGQVELKSRHTNLLQSPEFDVMEISDTYSTLKNIEARVVRYEDQMPMTQWLNYEKNTLSQKIMSLSLADGAIYVLELRATDEIGNKGPTKVSSTFQVGPRVILQNQTYSTGGVYDYEVQLSAPSIDDFELSYFSESTTALEGIDFVPIPLSKVRIPAGSDRMKISLQVMEVLQSGPRRTFEIKAVPTQEGLGTQQIGTITVPAAPNLTALPPLGLSNLFTAVDNRSNLGLGITSNDMTHYRYKLFSEANDDCSSYSNYGNSIDIVNNITDALSAFALGTNLTLCVIGKTATSYLSFFQHRWVRENLEYVYLGNTGNSYLLGETETQTMHVSLTATLNYPLVVYYSVEGTATAADHDLTSGSITIPAGQITTSINYQTLRNSSPEDKSFIIRLTGTDKPNIKVSVNTIQNNMIMDQDGGSNFFVVEDVTVGSAHTCQVRAGSGQLSCWGENESGQLGDGGTATAIYQPKIIDSGSAYQKVTAGRVHTCGILTNGTLKCWGNNLFYQLGDGTTTERLTPAVVDSGTTYSQVVASKANDSTCGITTAGVLKCWGLNSSGQLGDGTKTSRPVPTVIDSGTNYLKVSLGFSHTCGITTMGVLKCWGSASSYRLGTGGLVEKLSPTVIDSGNSYIAVSASNSTCAIRVDNQLRCWGDNSADQLGVDSASFPIVVPTSIDTAQSYKNVEVGNRIACGIKTDDGVRCWGTNSFGEIGNQSSGVFRPGWVGLGYLKKLSITKSTACGIDLIGVLRCWGSNSHGQLGIGDTSLRKSPGPVLDGGTSYKSVAAGSNHACGITTGGALKCWGGSNKSQTGNGFFTLDTIPKLVDPGVFYNKVATGTDHTCGLTTAGTIKCWGDNTYKQIDSRADTIISLPLTIDSGTTYSDLSSGGYHTCGITTTGTLKCWGRNNKGQLGDNSTVNRSSPVVIDPGVSYASISAGSEHSCGITKTGTLKCWGSNGSGRLGNGTTTDLLQPVVIDFGTSYSKVSAGMGTTCGITLLGVAKCWGANTRGEVGKRTTTSQFTTPQAVASSGEYYKDISVSYDYHVCGLSTTGDVNCWGDNGSGAVHVGSSAIYNYYLGPDPSNVGGVFSQISAGGRYYSSLAIDANFTCGVAATTDGMPGQIRCWGSNTEGQLGNGDDGGWVPSYPLPPTTNVVSGGGGGG